MLFFYLLNDNPIKHKYKKIIYGYVDPFFNQTWTLFSPNPINSNMSILVKFNYNKSDEINSTDWLDICEPLRESRKNSFINPIQRIQKFLQSSMSDVTETYRIAIENISKKDTLSKNSELKDKYINDLISSSSGHQSILEYSKYVFNKLENVDDCKNIYLSYKIVDSKFPRFSKRNYDYYDLSNYEYNEISLSLIKLK